MDFCIARLKTGESFTNRDVEKLRGYLGNRFIEDDIFHNHDGKFGFFYRFPTVQYRLLNNELCVFGVGDSIALMKSRLDTLDKICITDREISLKGIEYEDFSHDFEVGDDTHRYEFGTIYLALNKENYKKYVSGEIDLDRCIQNNLLSNFKNLGIQVDRQIVAKSSLEPVGVTLKDTRLVGFKGTFESNVSIPKYMSIGKRQSIGFGMVDLL